jgi:hypothetical protein
MKHPNMELSDAASHAYILRQRNSAKSMMSYKDQEKKDCSYYFLKLDFEILKPLLIYKFDAEEMHRQDDYIEIIMSDANLMGSIYGKMDDALFQTNDMAERERITIALSYVQKNDRNSSYRMRNTAAGYSRKTNVVGNENYF